MAHDMGVHPVFFFTLLLSNDHYSVMDAKAIHLRSAAESTTSSVRTCCPEVPNALPVVLLQ